MIDIHSIEVSDQEVQQIFDDAVDLGMEMIAMAFGVPVSLIIPTQAQQNAGTVDQTVPALQKGDYR